MRLEGELLINQPIDKVFDFTVDSRNEPLYNPNVTFAEKITEGPIGLGTKFRNQTRGMGKTTEWSIEVSSYERPKQYEVNLKSKGMEIQGIVSFTCMNSKTLLQWSWNVEPRGLFKLTIPLLKLWGQRFEENNWLKLKSYLEA